jgi:hypothetical protein
MQTFRCTLSRVMIGPSEYREFAQNRILTHSVETERILRISGSGTHQYSALVKLSAASNGLLESSGASSVWFSPGTYVLNPNADR